MNKKRMHGTDRVRRRGEPFLTHVAKRWQSPVAACSVLAPATSEPYISGRTACLFAPLHTGRMRRQRSLLGGSLTIAGTTYAHGLSVRSWNQMEVHSTVPMVRLEAVIGVDDAAPEPHGLRFNVKPGVRWVGQEVHEGVVLERGQPGQRISVELGRHPVRDVGDPATAGDHAGDVRHLGRGGGDPGRWPRAAPGRTS